MISSQKMTEDGIFHDDVTMMVNQVVDEMIEWATSIVNGMDSGMISKINNNSNKI